MSGWMAGRNSNCTLNVTSVHSKNFNIVLSIPFTNKRFASIRSSVRDRTVDSKQFAPTNFCKPSVVIDLGRSIGRPSARSQTNDDITPNARDTPNKTV
ncbi:hypothetical protein DERP_005500 [Dermatophagoides pteronyssinus]|uniref:Uncharacterized protein n=1 Tax=Dermatophagoides pteronyssinus TaxID=6956 RepID=A0ABQ8JN94_DERPT|nr:hypothetical protein DERP_005500 [Dermatophagoides pteronyssinus]